MLKFLKSLFGPGTDLKTLVQKGAIIIDVRTPEEFRRGHLTGSVNIPVDRLAGHADKLKKEGKVVITCCRSGSRSGMAEHLLRQKGIEAYNGGPWDHLGKRIS